MSVPLTWKGRIIWCTCGAGFVHRANFLLHVNQSWPDWAIEHKERKA